MMGWSVCEVGQRRLETVCQGPGLRVRHQSTSHPRTLTTNHTQQGVHRQEKPWWPLPIRWAINAHIRYLVLIQSEAQEWNEISASLVNSLFETYAGIFRAMGRVSNRPSRTWQFLHAIQMYYCHTTDSRHSSASLVWILIQNNTTLKTVT